MRWAAGPSSPVSFVPFSSSGSGVRCYESLGPPATTWHEWYCRGFPCQMIQCGFALNKSHPTWASDFLIQTGTQVDCDINKCWCNWKSKSTPAAQPHRKITKQKQILPSWDGIVIRRICHFIFYARHGAGGGNFWHDNCVLLQCFTGFRSIDDSWARCAWRRLCINRCQNWLGLHVSAGGVDKMKTINLTSRLIRDEVGF